MFRRHRTPSACPSCWCSILNALECWQVHILCCTGYLAVVLSLWRRDHNCIDSGRNDDNWWYRTPPFFMTMQGVTPLLSRISCTAGNGRFWNIHRTYPIWVHAITISLPKLKNHWAIPSVTESHPDHNFSSFSYLLRYIWSNISLNASQTTTMIWDEKLYLC